MSLVAIRRFLRRPPLGVKIAVLIVATVTFGAAGYIYFERPDRPGLTWADSFWWSVVTMTTVGYGDHFPATTPGRFLIAYPIMLIGMGFMALGLTSLAGFFLRAESLNRKGLMMTRHDDHVLVCNFPSRNDFARVLQELRAHYALGNRPVVLIDEHLEELDQDFAGQNVQFVRGNPAQREPLQRAGLEGAARAIVLARDPHRPESDNATVAICLTLKSLRSDLHVVAECVEPANMEVVRRSGCDGVVCVMSLAPGLLTQESGDVGVVDVLSELTIWDEKVNNIFIVPIEGKSGATVADLRRWSDGHEVTLLGIRSAGRVQLNPTPATAVAADDSAIVVSRTRPDTIVL